MSDHTTTESTMSHTPTPEPTAKQIEKIIDQRISDLDQEFFDDTCTERQLADIHARTQECYHLKKLLTEVVPKP